MAICRTQSTLLAAAALTVASCGGANDVSTAAPRLEEVPQQATTGDEPFSFDLDDYVEERDGAPLTFAVAAGGGSFTGSVYTNTFATMGEYTVEFTVTNGAKTSTGTFDVDVTAADLSAIQEGDTGLFLHDARSNQFLRVAADVTEPTFVADLANGAMVYSRTGASGAQLWVFDPFTRRNTRLSATATGDLTYEGKGSDSRVYYSVVDSGQVELHVYNSRSGGDRVLATSAEVEVTVASDNRAYVELGVGSNGDVKVYDPATDEVDDVAVGSTEERVVGTGTDGAVVITRVNADTGETDLFWHSPTAGLVEIGTDVAAIATDDKTWHATDSEGRIVFAADGEVFAWDPTSASTTNLSSEYGAGADDEFAALAAGNQVVCKRLVNPGVEEDVWFFDLDSEISATVRDGADVSAVLGVSGSGTTDWVFLRASGTTTSLLAVSLIATPATQTWAAGATVSTTIGILDNGDVVGQLTGGTKLNLFDVSAGTWGTEITGTGLTFAGDGVAAGDFVYSLTANAQTDLSMWDASGNASVVISNATGNDVFGARTGAGTVLFTRVPTSLTNRELFVFNGTAATQLTEDDVVARRHDHSVAATWSGSR
ncbi:MAG: hypothetical protein IPK26_17085 [Planctomycetes bacterium]|nr:hypothetical protein [Planctomycetota bacterium]